MKALLVGVAFGSVLLVSVMQTAFAAPKSDPTTTFKVASGGKINFCIKGAPRDEFGFPKRFAVLLAITHTFKRPGTDVRGRSNEMYRYNLANDPKLAGTRSYHLLSNYGRVGCSEIRIVTPFNRDDASATQVGLLKLRVSSAGRLLGRAAFTYTIRHVGARTIWQGTDEFINYCINGTEHISSSGGRLYCETPTRWHATVRRVS